MWPIWYHVLDPMSEVYINLKYRKIIWNDALEQSFKEIKHIISAETSLNSPNWAIPFTVKTDAYDKQLGAVISQNNKPMYFFSKRLKESQHNYNTTEK